MENMRKQVAFDLDTNALKVYYPSDSWNNAYHVIKDYMEKNGFEWQQGSVYTSVKPMESAKVTNILDNLVVQNPWLNICMRDCRETDIGKEHDKNHLFDKTAKVPTREELNAQIQQEGKQEQDQKKQESKQMSMGDYMSQIAKAKVSGNKQSEQQEQKQRTGHERKDR